MASLWVGVTFHTTVFLLTENLKRKGVRVREMEMEREREREMERERERGRGRGREGAQLHKPLPTVLHYMYLPQPLTSVDCNWSPQTDEQCPSTGCVQLCHIYHTMG